MISQSTKMKCKECQVVTNALKRLLVVKKPIAHSLTRKSSIKEFDEKGTMMDNVMKSNRFVYTTRLVANNGQEH